MHAGTQLLIWHTNSNTLSSKRSSLWVYSNSASKLFLSLHTRATPISGVTFQDNIYGEIFYSCMELLWYTCRFKREIRWEWNLEKCKFRSVHII